ncbi:MAG: glycosyltransferase [Lachnospiraceae bacterium]|nr:glycosyltransferase [Lachnospiraceae bacterium]
MSQFVPPIEGGGTEIRLKSNELLISVIVPVYNGQDYLANCIDSIENQTYRNLEIIIVNDGSTDRTSAVCDSLQTVYHNVRILTLDDRGVSAARNAGIEAAEGAFVTFVDADDRIRSDMIKILYDCMIETQSDVAGCGFFLWKNEDEWKQAADSSAQDVAASEADRQTADAAQTDETGMCELSATTLDGRTRVYDAGKYLREELLRGNSRCWSKLYRREIVEKVRFREQLTIGEDMLFLVQILPYINRIVETEYTGYGYYQNPTGAINRKFTPRYMDQITCWQLAREEILRMDTSLDPQVTALWIMGIMLTAGKIAMLDAADRRDCEKYIGICHENLKEAMKISGAYGKLSVGYRVKAAIFRVFPHLYLLLYHFHK